MSADVSELLKKALALPPEARAALAGSLLESLDDEPCDEGAEAAWNEEIKRRIEEIDSGKVQMIPYEEVRRRWRPSCQMPASKPYRFHPQAWQEVEAAESWYRRRNPEASIRFLSAIYDALERLARWPQRWPSYR